MNCLSKVGISALTLAISALSLPAAAEDPYQAFIKQPNADTAFQYIHQVAIHPRCQNCHGEVDKNGSFYPTVGEQRRPHPMKHLSKYRVLRSTVAPAISTKMVIKRVCRQVISQQKCQVLFGICHKKIWLFLMVLPLSNYVTNG